MASHPLLGPASAAEDAAAADVPAPPRHSPTPYSPTRDSDSEDDELNDDLADLEGLAPTRPGLKRRRTGWLEYQRLTTRQVLLGSAAVALLLVVVGTLASLSGLGRGVGRWEYRPPLDPSKRAVIIEKRNLPNLVPLLHDFIVKVSGAVDWLRGAQPSIVAEE